MNRRYLVQIRLVALPHPDDEPDEWSSARSTMTVAEVSVPFDSDYDPPQLHISEAYLGAMTKAMARLSLPDGIQE